MPPDLNNPVARAAYARELRAVARPIRYLGVGLALLGVAVAIAHRVWPPVPRVIALFLIVVAALHLFAGMTIRQRYHRQRMRG